MVFARRAHARDSRRRGVTAVIVVVSLTTLFAFAALTVDVGILYNTRSELQRTSDAASLAGTMALLDENRLRGASELDAVIDSARSEVDSYASYNKVGRDTVAVSSSDVAVGYLRDPTDATEAMDFSDPSRYNAVRVLTRRDSAVNGPIGLTFSWIFGHKTANVTASATAAMMDGINGFRATEETGNAGLLPIVLRQSSWLNLLSGAATTGDHWSYDPATGESTPGPDGVNELNLYPGSGAGQLPPGNFGTVDIGPPSNSTADLERQILEGVSASDLEYFGGELKLGSDGTLPLNGDTGLSAGLSDVLTSIIGQPRSIPIFTTVAGPGNNAWFTVVGFVGIRVMEVKLTGSMTLKRVVIQPAIVMDDSALAGPATGSSYFVYQPVRLVR